MQYSNYKNPNSSSKKWCTSTITNILKDRIYIGDLVQHKYASVNYKIKKVVKIEKDKNIIIENHHEPIIAKEEFLKVQEMLEQKSNECNRYNREPHILTGIAFCKQCGARITYTKNHGKEFKIICSNYKKRGKTECNGMYMSENKVIEIVKNCILNKIKSKEMGKIKIDNNEKKKEKINELIKEKEKNIKAIKQVYTDIANELLKQEIANKLILEYVKENERIDMDIDKMRKGMKEEVFDVIEMIEKSEPKELRSLIYTLIQKIELKNDSINIYYKFIA